MNKTNEMMISRTKEQAFDTIAAMVAGRKEVDSSQLISTIQNFKQMIDFNIAAIERMEKEMIEAE